MKSYDQLAASAYAAYLKSAYDQQKLNPNLWIKEQPAWEALIPEMQECWLAAARQLWAEFAAVH